MKNERIRRRATALLLSLLMWVGCVWFTPRVSAADLVIDDSAFRDPTKTSMTIYQWVEGLPPYSWSQTYGKKFPTLITWDDAYYLKITLSVAENMEDNIHAYTSALKDGWSEDNDDCGLSNGSFGKNKNGYPHGTYYMDMMYYGSLLSELDSSIDFSLLNANGSMFTLDLPSNIPNMIPTYPANSGGYTDDSYTMLQKNCVRYSIEVDLPNSWEWYDTSYVGNFDTDGGFRRGENYLIGVRKDDCTHEVIDNPWYEGDDYIQYNGFRWSLYALNDTTALNCTNNAWFDSVNFSYRDYTTGAKDHQYNSYGWPKYFAWYALERTENGKKYQGFWTPGVYFHVKNFYIDDNVGGHKECKKLTISSPNIALAHNGDKFETKGDREGNTIYTFFNYTGYLSVLAKQFTFRCWYAKPYTIDCISTNYTVEPGQVSNLDGPIAITNNAKITVKDGGTLSISGWCMNNGTINVEEGGTLWIQDGACVCRYNDGTTYGGGIISNGLVIVGEDAKLIGGGADGIQLLNGSHVVNYGCVASENFKITNDHTIENREKGFVLSGLGNGVLNFGNLTYQTPLTYSTDSSGHYTGTYAERGQVLQTSQVEIVSNAIYWD